MGENPGGVVANVLDYDLVVSEFELQLHYYVHFHSNTQEFKFAYNDVAVPQRHGDSSSSIYK